MDTATQKTFEYIIQDLLPYIGDEQRFLEKIDAWVLVGPPLEAEDGWAFRTGSIQTVRDAETGNILILEPSYEVRLLKKVPGALFQDTILIGRSGTSDVVVPDASISKLHVRVRFTPPTLADANSSNGTTYNKIRLDADRAVPLSDASTLVIGERCFNLISPKKFRELLQTISIGQHL